MRSGLRNSCCMLALLASLSGGCAFPWLGADPTLSADRKRARWWAKQQPRAELVEGKGYKVPNMPGYFDDEGRLVTGEYRRPSDAPPPAPPTATLAAAAPTDVAPPTVVAAGDTPGAPSAALAVAVDTPDDTSPVERADYLQPTDETPGGPDEVIQAGVTGATALQAAVAPRQQPRPVTAPQLSPARRLYEEGQALFRRQEYRAARSRFEKAAKKGADSGDDEDALFMVAESNFFEDRYPQAADAYTALVKEYPNTRHLDRVSTRQFAIARYWQQQQENDPEWPVTPNLFDKTRHRFHTLGHAMRMYENIRLNDPTGPLADDALMAIAGIHFKAGRFEDADYHYGLLRREYSDSEHQYEAHLLGLQSKVRRYQGPSYDGTPLKEAEQLVERMLSQFPDKMGPEERKRLVTTQQQVAAAQALRDWQIAEYYSGRQEYGSARDYYAEIVRKYPDTELAKQSRSRLKEYAPLPSEPGQKLPWLANLFPEGDGQPGALSVGKPAPQMARQPAGSGPRR